MRIIRISRTKPDAWKEWNHAAVVAYELGGKPNECAILWLWSQVYPGLVILKESHYHPAIWAACKASGDREQYLALMQACGGADARRAGEICWGGGCHPDEISSRYTMARAAAANALGVLAHNEEVFKELNGCIDVPLVYAAPGHCTRLLEELAETAPNQRARRAGLDLSTRVGRGLRDWASPAAAEQIIGRVNQDIASLFA